VKKNSISYIHCPQAPLRWSSSSIYPQCELNSSSSYSSADSLATGTTDTDFYRDWRHSIDFVDFNDLYYDSKFNFDKNQNVVYV